MEKINYHGWTDCIRLANDSLELIVTTRVGPRIMHLARPGGNNLLGVNESLLGAIGPSDKWVNYGGHRLWHGPEHKHHTYQPDNEQVDVSQDGDGTLFTAPTEPGTGIQKQMRVAIAAGSEPLVVVNHLLTNRSTAPISLAVWALTVVAPGGRVIFPQERYAAHGENDEYLPSRPLILWPYTNMADKRWSWGTNYIQLRSDAAENEPQKLGAYVSEGWGAYTRPDGDALIVFITPPQAGPESYIDFGSNYETFTKGDFQELETLGPLCRLEPGETASHRETWYVAHGEPLPMDDTHLNPRFEALLGDAAKCIVKAHLST